MTSATKEYAALGKRRQELQEEAARLRREGEKAHVDRDLDAVSRIAKRLASIDSELFGTNLAYKDARRQHAAEAAQEMGQNVAYSRQVRAVLENLEATLGGWATLAGTTRTARGEGVDLPVLPDFILAQLAEVRAWLREMIRAGVLPLDDVPASLASLVADTPR